MSGSIDKKLAELGITLPTPAAPIANYVGFVRTGQLLVVSGQLCLGRTASWSPRASSAAASPSSRASRPRAPAPSTCSRRSRRRSAISTRSPAWCGSAASSIRTPDFLDGPKVMNGASDLMVAVFGDKGRHARTTVGVAVLPLDAAVEVEGTVRGRRERRDVVRRHAGPSTG